MSTSAECEVIGRWRIVEGDQWDRDYLDLVDPAFIRFDRDGYGELAFGVVTAGLNLQYARTVVFFTFEGLTKATRSVAPGRPNSPRTALSRSNSRSTTAMTRSFKRRASEFFNSLLDLQESQSVSSLGVELSLETLGPIVRRESERACRAAARLRRLP